MNTNHVTILGTRAAVLLTLAIGAASTASAQYAPAPVAPNGVANTVNAVTSLVTGQPAPAAGYYYPNAAYPAGAAYPGYAPGYPATTYYHSGYNGYVQPQAAYAGQPYGYPQQAYPYSQPMTGNRYVDAARTLIQPQYQPAATGYYYQQPAVQGLFRRR